MSELLRLEGVRKHRAGRKVLDRFDLSVCSGDRIVLFGENGSGKSTVIALVVGLLAPERGSVSITGVRLERDRASALRNVGYAPDRPDAPDHLRVDEWFAIVASLRRAPLPAPQTLEPLRIVEVERLPLRALSFGQKRRVAIATALIGSPPLLVLDEPTVGLDAEAVPSLVRLLRAHTDAGGGVLCATHDAAFASAVATRTVTLPA